MTKPRRHIPGQVALVTRCCSERRYFLKPDDYIRRVTTFETGKAAERHGQHIYAAVAMPNYVQFVMGDTTAERSRFMQDAMSAIARARNRDLGRKGHFWAAGQFGNRVLMGRDTIERRLLNIWLAPVQAGFVDRAEDWPGLMIMPKHWGETITIDKPSRFYGRANPDRVEFTPKRPPGYDDMSLQEVKEHFQRLLKIAEDEIEAVRQEINQEANEAGQACELDPNDSPKTPEPPRRRIPRFATQNEELMERARSIYRRFLDQYETVRQRWVSGKKSVEFPAGTVQLRRCAPVSCAAPPEDEPTLFAKVE